MKQIDADPRYMTVVGCLEMAVEMDRQARSAKLLMQRHEGWARALRSRADKIEKAEMLEAEAKAERFAAERVANTRAPERPESPLDWLFEGCIPYV